MIMFHDLLHRQSGGAPANPDAVPIHSAASSSAPANPDAAPTHSAASTRKARKPLPRNPLPYLNLPKQWAMELQKIAFQLSPMEKDQSRPMSFVFSSLDEGAGTTTVSYFFAYVLAADAAHRNILFVDFDPEANKPALTGARATFFVGQEDFSLLLSDPDTNLDAVSVRVGPDGSITSSSAWFSNFMAIAHQTYDIIVVDAPPIADTHMAYAPARSSDGIVLVLRAGEARYPAINTLVNDLNGMGIAILGAVLNSRQYPIPKALLKLL